MTPGGWRQHPKPGWAAADILGPLSEAAGAPATIDTDVNGAALAEMRWGSGRGMDDFAYITVGTGVGVGLVVNGRPTRGFGHSELGHIRVAAARRRRIRRIVPVPRRLRGRADRGPSLKARVGERIDEIAADDPLWDSVAWALAQLCHVIVCAAAPRAIAIGGGVVGNQPHLLERIAAMLVDSLAGYVALPGSPYLCAPALGDNAGPLGAIALAMTARR